MSKQAVSTNQAPGALGPYSQGIICGNLVFVSGQLGASPEGVLAATVSEQAELSLKNVQSILTAAGSSMDKVVKCTVFLTDMADFQAVNEIYGKFFAAPYPGRSCIQVCALPKGALVEVEAIAAL